MIQHKKGIEDPSAPIPSSTSASESAAGTGRLGHQPESLEKFAFLRLHNSSVDLKYIKHTYGYIGPGPYSWVFSDSVFLRWLNTEDSTLLRITGGSARDRSLLLTAIADRFWQLESIGHFNSPVSYFFCRPSEESSNTTTSILKGLIRQLVLKRPALASYLDELCTNYGHEALSDVLILSNLLKEILQYPAMPGVILIIDAVDERIKDLYDVLKLVGRTPISLARWIISSNCVMDSDLETERPLYTSLNLAQCRNLAVLCGLEVDNIIAKIWLQKGSLWELCPTILYILASTHENMRVGDLRTAIELKYGVLIDNKTIRDAVKFCPTMLGIEKDFVYFTHPAAREYIESKPTDWVSAFTFRPSLGNAQSVPNNLEDSLRQALQAIQDHHQSAIDGHSNEDSEDGDSLGDLPESRMLDWSYLRRTTLPTTTATSLPETKARAPYLETRAPPGPAATTTCFSVPAVEQETRPGHLSIQPSPATSRLPPGWEMDYDGKAWFYQYKPTGFVQYVFPKEQDPHTVIHRYDEIYSDQLLEAYCAILKDLKFPGMKAAKLANILNQFASKLLFESLTIFHWNASVAMRGMTVYVGSFFFHS